MVPMAPQLVSSERRYTPHDGANDNLRPWTKELDSRLIVTIVNRRSRRALVSLCWLLFDMCEGGPHHGMWNIWYGSLT